MHARFARAFIDTGLPKKGTAFFREEEPQALYLRRKARRGGKKALCGDETALDVDRRRQTKKNGPIKFFAGRRKKRLTLIK